MTTQSKYVTFRQLKDEYDWPYSRQHTDRLEKLGRIPLRVTFGGHVFWVRDEWETWFAARLQERQRLRTELPVS